VARTVAQWWNTRHPRSKLSQHEKSLTPVNSGLHCPLGLWHHRRPGAELPFALQCLNRDQSAQLPDGATAVGFVRVDDIEFFWDPAEADRCGLPRPC
jgi:hypothetical protein